jgi:hypothetical protein
VKKDREDGIDLVRTAEPDNGTVDGWVAQRPGDCDRPDSSAVAVGDPAKSLHEFEVPR